MVAICRHFFHDHTIKRPAAIKRQKQEGVLVFVECYVRRHRFFALDDVTVFWLLI